MAKKDYDWELGAVLDEHTKKKHSILKDYFRQYLITRCQLPKQTQFRIVIVDGFSGGGLYKCGTYGSPIIFIRTLAETTNEINTLRVAQGIEPINVQCLFIANDLNLSAITKLKENIAPHEVYVRETCSNISLTIVYLNKPFEDAYVDIKGMVLRAKCRNVFFNLDQCGYSHVTSPIIRDIMNSFHSAEVILTFMISSMLTYLSFDKSKSGVPLEPEMKSNIDALRDSEIPMNTAQWLGGAEKIAFELLKGCANFVSPFSINNPNGWQYWLMHFANSYRARQVYNNILHQSGASQAHFGRSGLKMLSYDPRDDGQYYIFDNNSRKAAKESLYDDIPRFVAESGDAISMQDFYVAAYSETPAHSDDIHEMIIANPDMEVVTEKGGKRRQPNTIKVGDTLRLKSQKSMFFMFTDFSKNK